MSFIEYKYAGLPITNNSDVKDENYENYNNNYLRPNDVNFDNKWKADWAEIAQSG